jgi:hypothetical protein
MTKEPYRLPDRPRRDTRPTTQELRDRLAAMRLLQAGREGKN